jgi:thiol-disulfide isomerase/thioredoxin
VAVIVAAAVGGLLFIKSQVRNPMHPEGEAPPEIAVGATLPDFELVPLGGGQPVASSRLGARVILVNFWATWCEACMIEMPSIEKLRAAYRSRGFEVVAVNVDENPDAVVPRVIKQLGLSFPIYVDKDARLAELFDVHAIPLTVILDNRTRKILFIESGERDWNGADIRSRLDSWLSG